MSDGSLASGATHAAAAVSSRAATQAISTTFSVILSLSFCHLLNDGGLGAAALGKLADLTSITTVYRVCPFLLLLGLLTAFLPRRPGAPSLHR